MSNDKSTLMPLLRKLERHVALSAADQGAVLALPHQVRAVEPGAYLVREGDVPGHCCVLLSGFAYRHKIVGDGGRQILSVHITGDAVDLQHALLDLADHNVQTLTRLDAAFIPSEAIAEIAARHPAVGRAMWIDTLIEGSVHREWIANVGRRDSRTRLAHLLCELATRQKAAGLSEGDDYQLPLTQEQLADATGLTSVHINRVLQALRADGVIAMEKKRVTISDWNRMTQIGDFSARYLHLQQDRPLPA